MSLKAIAVAATMGMTALAVSGCVETSGSYGGGYYHRTPGPVVIDRSHRDSDRNDWRRDRRDDQRHDRRDDYRHDSRSSHDRHSDARHGRSDRRTDSRHTPSRYEQAKFCRDNPRAPQCRSDRRH